MQPDMTIQWFPGHMTKARRMMAENVKLVDAVCEVIDARIPISSRNPDIDALLGGRTRLLIVNRIDQADPEMTKKWVEYFRKAGVPTLQTDGRSGAGTSGFPRAVKETLQAKLDAYAAKGQAGRTVRVMVVGIPNVGKSALINKIAGRKAALTSDRPGVTRGKQWISVARGLELLDTPGVLWPKFDSPTVGENLAFTGAIKDDIVDIETLGAHLLTRLCDGYADKVAERYKFTPDTEADGFDMLAQIARRRGYIAAGNEVDIRRAAQALLDDFRSGKLGRITLEIPSELEQDDGFMGV